MVRDALYLTVVIVLALLLWAVSWRCEENRVQSESMGAELRSLKNQIEGDGQGVMLLRQLRKAGVTIQDVLKEN